MKKIILILIGLTVMACAPKSTDRIYRSVYTQKSSTCNFPKTTIFIMKDPGIQDGQTIGFQVDQQMSDKFCGFFRNGYFSISAGAITTIFSDQEPVTVSGYKSECVGRSLNWASVYTYSFTGTDLTLTANSCSITFSRFDP